MTTQPDGIGENEHTVRAVCPVASAMEYATPVPGQPALEYELVTTHPAGIGELEQTIALPASFCGAACDGAVAADIMPSSINTTVTTCGMRFRKVLKAGLIFISALTLDDCVDAAEMVSETHRAYQCGEEHPPSAKVAAWPDLIGGCPDGDGSAATSSPRTT
ncbi:hypothetical protein ACIF8W_29205 [Streptomyces sp. NPDC085639]|uniref:hypothetical protein n=1 Tax=Streptomyces sp. NPDC085639 TaxID=3365734 RepID=UPI0037D8CBB4